MTRSMGMRVATGLAMILTVALTLRYFSSVRQPPRLVLLYATCSLPKNVLSPYKNSIRYTPNLEAFAKESIVFDRHQTETPFSGGSYASLFTGVHTYRHGVYYHPYRLDDRNYLMAEAFRDQGYDTYFWNGHDLASYQLNYSQGVPVSNIVQFQPWKPGWLTGHDGKFTSLLKRLASERNYRAFLQVNFSVTHAPYTNNSSLENTEKFCRLFPEECPNITHDDLVTYRKIYASNHIKLQTRFKETVLGLKLTPVQVEKLIKIVEVTYRSSVYLMDKYFGETIQQIRQLGLIENSLIVFTSDHGEVLYRPNSQVMWFHSYLEPEVMSVPLIIRLPGANPRYVYRGITRCIDVFPTISGLCGIKIPSSKKIDGVNLSAALLKKTPPPDLIAFSCSEIYHPAVTSVDPRTITVQARIRDSIYYLLTQPDGSSELLISSAEEGIPGATLSKRKANPDSKVEKSLREYRDLLIQGYRPAPKNETEWQSIRENLRSLGYVN